MAFREVASLDADTTTALGGVNKKTGKANPTNAEGYFLGSRQVASPMSKTGFAFVHVIQTAKGNLGIWGKTDLDRKIKQVSVGTMIRITMTGMQPIPGKQPMYKFRVQEDPDNVIEVAGATEDTLAAGSPEQDFATDNGSDAELTDDGFVDRDLGDDDQLPDEVAPVRAQPPSRPVASPDAARAAKVKELLAKGGRKSA